MKSRLYIDKKTQTMLNFRSLLFVFCFSLLLSSLSAQDTLYVYKSNAVINKQAVADIDSIIFYDDADGAYTDTFYMYESGHVVNTQDMSVLDSVSFHTKRFAPLESVTDQDGNEYGVVKIGSQVWMDENLRTTTCNNGDPLSPGTAGDNPGYTWYQSDSDPDHTAGALYNFHAVETGNLCPSGFRVASKEDWETLVAYMRIMGYEEDEEAYPLKTVDGWQRGDGGIDAFGFGAPAGGYCTVTGGYTRRWIEGYWWTSSALSSSFMYYVRMGNRHETNDQSVLFTIEGAKRGHSVRCIRND